MAAEDIRVLIPRVRRAVEGVGQPETLTDDQMKDIIADAIADVILFTGGVFGKELIVTERDVNGAPTEYETSEPLTPAEGSIIAAQAALNMVFNFMRELKISETIKDEGQEWTYTTSATLLRDRVKLLQWMRDQALLQLTVPMPTSFTSFLHERDELVARQVEPFYPGY